MIAGKQHLCPKCGKPKSQSFRFDADYCGHCNIWLTPICDTEGCIFCAERPEKPNKFHKAEPDVIKGR